MARFSDRFVSANKLIIAAAVLYSGCITFAHAADSAHANDEIMHVVCATAGDQDRLRASTAKDVSKRLEHPNDDRTAAERSRQGSEARQKALQTTQANKTAPFPEWLRTG
jgi:hypothetical protein